MRRFCRHSSLLQTLPQTKSIELSIVLILKDFSDLQGTQETLGTQGTEYVYKMGAKLLRFVGVVLVPFSATKRSTAAFDVFMNFRLRLCKVSWLPSSITPSRPLNLRITVFGCILKRLARRLREIPPGYYVLQQVTDRTPASAAQINQIRAGICASANTTAPPDLTNACRPSSQLGMGPPHARWSLLSPGFRPTLAWGSTFAVPICQKRRFENAFPSRRLSGQIDTQLQLLLLNWLVGVVTEIDFNSVPVGTVFDTHYADVTFELADKNGYRIGSVSYGSRSLCQFRPSRRPCRRPLP